MSARAGVRVQRPSGLNDRLEDLMCKWELVSIFPTWRENNIPELASFLLGVRELDK